MPVTTIESSQIRASAVQRSDLNTTTVGQSVVAKLLQGTNISLSSTGADSGTGDVTVSLGAHASTHNLGGSDAISALIPAGTVLDFAGASAPTGFLLCDGSAVSRTTYSGLYTVLGGSSSPWGQGDGSTTFNVPDLRGRVAIGGGQGTGLTNRTLGATGGEETHLLSIPEMPSHTHTIANMSATQITYAGGGGSLSPFQNAGGPYTGENSTGGGGAHNTMQPFAVVNKIIKT